MSDDQYVNLPLSFEYLMSFLFGKHQYHGYVGLVPKRTWKKDMVKVAKYIRKAIILNVSSDQCHKEELCDLCDRLERDIKSAKSIEQANVVILERLIKIIFQLLGSFPNHWNRKSPYANKFWEFNGHRSLTYTQNEKQKTYLLLNLIDIKKKYSIDLPENHDLHDVFYQKFKGNHSEFLFWFRSEHPEIYSSVF